ncbi:neuronal pentraxin-2 [Nematostella vectensis]|nr:neuronal pentraxin-2 [Nematostella vectensis]
MFRRNEKGWRLADQEFKSVQVFSEFECARLCVDDPRCKSANYKEAAEQSVCQLNSETSRSRKNLYIPEEGYTFLEPVKSACVPSSCPAGYDCHDVLDSHDVLFECKPKTDFQISFAERTTSDYVRLDKKVELTKFTLSLSIRIDENVPNTFFSYASSNNNGIMIRKATNEFKFAVQGDAVRIPCTIIADSRFHSVVATWSNSEGEFQFYVDNSLVTKEKNLATGRTISGGGVFIIGNEQDDLGGGFSFGNALVGTITRVNLWGVVLPDEYIKVLGRGCGNEVGTVLAWTEFYQGAANLGYHGNARFEEPSTCA